jgi:hypothetical protein
MDREAQLREREGGREERNGEFLSHCCSDFPSSFYWFLTLLLVFAAGGFGSVWLEVGNMELWNTRRTTRPVFTHASLQVLLPVARVEGPFFSRVISSVCIYFVLSTSTVDT